MNFLFISPHFPPQFSVFCRALKDRGIHVLGLGDTPGNALSHEVTQALNEYVYVPDLENYEAAYRAAAFLISKYGRIARVDSHNEHWLAIEAQLREDFNIPGPKVMQMAQWRSKTGMAQLFANAQVPHIVGEKVTSLEDVRAFAARHGYPLVLKPDVGVGASRTYKISHSNQLGEIDPSSLSGYLVQPFIEGSIVSYDGLLDDQGRVLIDFSHEYSSGVMDVVNQRLDMSYWSLREIPEVLKAYGSQILKAFGIRERFFHIEFFRQPDGSYCALEVNVRPPGGFTTDMMNYTADVDIYQLWARMISGEQLETFRFTRKFHVAHVSRRQGHQYREEFESVRRHLGERLMMHVFLPQAWSQAMGEEAFLIRARDLNELKKDIALIQA